MRLLSTGSPVGLIVAFAWTAWAAIGLATGHMYWQVWRGPPAHFAGWAALAFSLSVFAAASICFLHVVGNSITRIEVARRKSLSLVLFGVYILLLITAIATQSLPPTDGVLFGKRFNGMVSADSLSWLMWSPKASQVIENIRESVSNWLVATCIGLLVLAVFFKFLGVSKTTIARYPIVFAPLASVCGLPFLAAFSIELLSYVVAYLPSNASSMSNSEFSSKASLALSLLVVVVATWFTVALVIVAVLARSCGVRVQWNRQESLAT